MSNAPNYLRVYRKRSPLTQGDIGFLMSLPDYSNISRYEKGQRTPSIEILLVYHLLFNTSIEQFFEPELEIIHANLLERMEKLIVDLKKDSSVLNNSSRIKFLELVINRLTT